MRRPSLRTMVTPALLAMAAAAPLALPASAQRPAVGESPALAGAPASRGRFLMGTRLLVTIPQGAGEEVFEAVFAEVERLERILSNWDAGSELSRLNREASGEAVRCSEDLFRAVTEARRWAAATDGAFDPTVEPLVRRFGLRGKDGRWGPAGDVALGATDPGARPASAVAVDPAPSSDGPVGWRHIRLVARDRSVRFEAAGVGIDLGGIGKGIALDAAARVLAREGVRSALLDFGGQVLVVGSTGSGAWPVGIVDPGDRDRAAGWIALRGGSLSTSGNGERGRGDGAGHILDPGRRMPAAFDGTVTALAPDATAADALSTALFVMGVERGLAWAEHRGVAVLYQWRAADDSIIRKASRGFPAFSERSEAARGGA